MWLWAQRDPAIHTLVVGAARPSDFDEHVAAAKQYVAYEQARLAGKDVVKEVEAKLMAAYDEAWAPFEGWGKDWWVGLPDCYQVRFALVLYLHVYICTTYNTSICASVHTIPTTTTSIEHRPRRVST